MIKLMDSDIIIIKKEVIILVNGKMIYSKVMELRIGQMEVDMKGIFSKEINKDKENIIGKMGHCILFINVIVIMVIG